MVLQFPLADKFFGWALLAPMPLVFVWLFWVRTAVLFSPASDLLMVVHQRSVPAAPPPPPSLNWGPETGT